MSARDAIPALFSAAPARSTVRKYDVRIKFEDGTYEGSAWAGSPSRAHELARIDARMLACSGTFYGRELGWTAELAKV
ncbi:hypothetical protein [Janthinobacterium sp.]|uniref:hypothetical protein n=1 Tax=Janthinobacterium sp. TaxID=1871054 RepID=UPI00260A4874|nr:hypothetical protein [Janthinobacterium sp.]